MLKRPVNKPTPATSTGAATATKPSATAGGQPPARKPKKPARQRSTTTATAGHQTMVPVGSTVTTKTRVTPARTPRVRKSTTTTTSTQTQKPKSWVTKVGWWWILWILLVAIIVWLLWMKPWTSIPSWAKSSGNIGNTESAKQGAIPKTTDGARTVEATAPPVAGGAHAGTGAGHQAVVIGNSNIVVQTGCCHGTTATPPPPAKVSIPEVTPDPKVKVLPRDLTPSVTPIDVYAKKEGVKVLIPAGEYRIYRFPQSGWKVNPTTFADPNSYEVEVDGRAVANDSGTVKNKARYYRITNKGSEDMEVHFSFCKPFLWFGR